MLFSFVSNNNKMASQIVAAWIFTAFSCVITIISLLATLVWLIYGACNKKFHNSTTGIATRLLITNCVAAVAFVVTTVATCIHCIQLLADSLTNNSNSKNKKQFITDFEAENLQFSLLLSSSFYLIGKFLLYFVLYFRLFYLLNESIFAYNPKYYFRIKCGIATTIVCAFAIMILSIFHNDYLEMISNLFTILYLLCDIIVPVVLNFMFIKKMHEIQIFIAEKIEPQLDYQSRSLSNQPHSKDTYGDDNGNNINNGQLPSDIDVPPLSSTVIPSASTSSTSSPTRAISMEKIKSRSLDAMTSGLNVTDKDTHAYVGKPQTPRSMSGSISNQRRVSSKDEKLQKHKKHKKLDHETLLVLITRVGLLSAVITVSSLIFLVIVAMYTWTEIVEDQTSIMTPILWISMAADGCINTVCLILYFNFATPMYKLLCCCCTTRCVSTVLPKCLCKCCK